MATVRDVARHSGVSVATVSLVLNGRDEKLTRETVDKVLDAIRELHYRPPARYRRSGPRIARGLAVIVPDYQGMLWREHHYHRRLLDGLIEACLDEKYSVTVTTESMWADGQNSIRERFDGSIDGVCLVSLGDEPPILAEFQRRGIPAAVVSSAPPSTWVSTVETDEIACAFKAVNHLAALGHRRIAYMGIPVSGSAAERRQYGYFMAMKSLGLSQHARAYITTRFYDARPPSRSSFLNHESSSSSEHIVKEGFPWVPELVSYALKEPQGCPTGVFAFADFVAYEAWKAFEQHGLRVPQDVSIVGVDADPVTLPDGRRVTTIAHPIIEVGAFAGRDLLRRIRDPKAPTVHAVFHGDLRVGDSCAPPPQSGA